MALKNKDFSEKKKSVYQSTPSFYYSQNRSIQKKINLHKRKSPKRGFEFLIFPIVYLIEQSGKKTYVSHKTNKVKKKKMYIKFANKRYENYF